jgi:hypothetical protein
MSVLFMPSEVDRDVHVAPVHSTIISSERYRDGHDESIDRDLITVVLQLSSCRSFFRTRTRLRICTHALTRRTFRSMY